ncbi:unnamed protein product [Urochloa humidicola]
MFQYSNYKIPKTAVADFLGTSSLVVDLDLLVGVAIVSVVLQNGRLLVMHGPELLFNLGRDVPQCLLREGPGGAHEIFIAGVVAEKGQGARAVRLQSLDVPDAHHTSTSTSLVVLFFLLTAPPVALSTGAAAAIFSSRSASSGRALMSPPLLRSRDWFGFRRRC